MGDGKPSDAEVIQRCRRGDIEPFRLLVERYQDRVYNLAYRLLHSGEDARDASQDTFIRAFEALQRFDPDRPFAPWLLRIATNTCYGMLRKRRPEISLEAIVEPAAGSAAAWVTASPESEPQHRLIQAVRDEEIQQAVLALPEPARTVVLLRYLEDMPYEAIAAALEMPLGTVKTYLYRARQRLRRALLEEETDVSPRRHGDTEHGL